MAASWSLLILLNKFNSRNVKSERYIQVLCKKKPPEGTGFRHFMDCRKTIAMRRDTNVIRFYYVFDIKWSAQRADLI